VTATMVNTATTVSVSGAVAALLEGLVDFAGLFPPAALSMRDAVARYATYHAGAHRRMLGRFVVPVARLEELAVESLAREELARDELALARPPMGPPASRGAGAPWRLAVLATAADATTLDAFNRAHPGRFIIDTVEAKAEDAATISALAGALSPRFTVYVEVGVRADPAPLIAEISRHGLRAKIRTGGVTLDAFPTTVEVLRFLSACVAARVSFKATAGLHHPLRGEFALTYAADSPRGTMHGFLNVFLAALLLGEGVGAADVAPLLEERDPAAIVATADAITWRGHRVNAQAIAAARATFAGSFGSCSFEEPVQDLTRLRLA
jgi:hypothetical protein